MLAAGAGRAGSEALWREDGKESTMASVRAMRACRCPVKQPSVVRSPASTGPTERSSDRRLHRIAQESF